MRRASSTGASCTVIRAYRSDSFEYLRRVHRNGAALLLQELAGYRDTAQAPKGQADVDGGPVGALRESWTPSADARMAANQRHPQPPQTRQTPAGTRRSLKQHHGPSRTACPRAKHTPRSRRRRPESPLYATPSLAEASVNRGRASVLVGRRGRPSGTRARHTRLQAGRRCGSPPLVGLLPCVRLLAWPGQRRAQATNGSWRCARRGW